MRKVERINFRFGGRSTTFCSSVPEHKYLGVILQAKSFNSKLNFKSHIKEAVVKARRSIGIIRHISRYVSREVLDQVYKLYVRPHLDYGDIVYHKYNPEMKL